MKKEPVILGPTSGGTEPAFPTETYRDREGKIKRTSGGLTKREYFAAMAMQGLTTHKYSDTQAKVINARARLAILHADALIKGLAKDET